MNQTSSEGTAWDLTLADNLLTEQSQKYPTSRQQNYRHGVTRGIENALFHNWDTGHAGQLSYKSAWEMQQAALY